MTDKTKTVSVRLNVETVDALNKRFASEGLSLRDFLSVYAGADGFSSGVNTKRGSDETPSESGDGVNTTTDVGVNTKVDPETMSNVANMCILLGVSLDNGMRLFREALEDGRLSIEGGQLVLNHEIDLSGFYEVCHEKNLDLQKAMDKAVQMLWK